MKSIKIVSILMIAMMLIMTATPVFAQVDVSDIQPSYDGTGTSTTSMKNLAGKILGFIRNAALVGGVIIIAILGFKYMMGSLEEKAEYKKSFIPLIVGIIVVMSATTIASLLFDTFTIS